QLKKEKLILVIVSTHGECDPPDRVVELHEHIFGKRAPKLPDLEFSVLALGDRTYKHYCKIVKDFDTQLEALGAKRIVDRMNCDVNFDEPAKALIEQVVAATAERSSSSAAPAIGITGLDFPAEK